MLFQEGAFLLCSALIGLLTGTGFPLAVARIQHPGGGTVRAGALAEAADHLGGALGALLTATLLIPILGLEGAAQLLALAALSALLPLWRMVRFPVQPHRRLAGFPYPRLIRFCWWLVLSALVIGMIHRQVEPQPQTTFSAAVLAQASGSATFELLTKPFPLYRGQGGVLGETQSVTLASWPPAKEVKGYAGPLELLVSMDQSGKLRHVRYLHSQETPSYIQGLQVWLDRLAGYDLSRSALSLEGLDALSGATITSRAALESINRTARAASLQAWSREMPPKAQGAPTLTDKLLEPRFLLLALLLLLSVPIYLKGQPWQRSLLMGSALVVLGVIYNALLTEIDLGNGALGRITSLESNPAWYLLALSVAVMTLLFGQLYCGQLCPFGALQEWVSRFGGWLGWRTRFPLTWETPARFLKYLLLAFLLAGLLPRGDVELLSINPMQRLFSGSLPFWMLGTLLITLAGSLLFYRFWCRYLCPLGAFMALGNRIALLERWGPKRRFKQCDLGVGHAGHVDCIRCLRCTRPDPQVGSDDTKAGKSVMMLAQHGRAWWMKRRWWLSGLLLLTLFTMSMQLGVTLQQEEQPLGGWRRIDTLKLQEQIRSGRLSQHPALWAKPGGAEESRQPGR